MHKHVEFASVYCATLAGRYQEGKGRRMNTDNTLTHKQHMQRRVQARTAISKGQHMHMALHKAI